MPLPMVAAVERTVSELGGINILVNNAGIAVMGPFESFKLADFDRTLAINVRAVFVAAQAAGFMRRASSHCMGWSKDWRATWDRGESRSTMCNPAR